MSCCPSRLPPNVALEHETVLCRRPASSAQGRDKCHIETPCRCVIVLAMARWTACTRVAGAPDEVLGVLTEPDAIARWSPIDFQVLDFAGSRLGPGDRVRVRGNLIGRSLEFDVVVREADGGRLALSASGPVRFDVEYEATGCAEGSEVCASVAVSGQGFWGRALAQATESLLAAGALRAALERIARQVEPAFA